MEPIRSTYEDDPDMLELVREFVSELPERIGKIEERMAAADWTELQTVAHQLKGAGGGYGLQPITDRAGELEQALKEGQNDAAVKDLVSALCEVLRAVHVGEAD